MSHRLQNHSSIIFILLMLFNLSGCSAVSKKQEENPNSYQPPQLTKMPTVYDQKAELYKNIILGRIAQRKHLDQQALDYYLKALTIEVNSKLALQAINISESLQQPETSIKIAKLWLIKQPNALTPLKLITYYSMSDENNANTLPWIENILSLELDEKKLLVFLGRLIATNNQKIQSKPLRIFKQLNISHPDNIAIQISLARIYQKQKRWDEALKWYQKSIIALPNSIELKQRLGHLLYELDYYPEAREQFLNLLKVSPLDTEASYMVAACYFAENNFPKSRDYFEPLLRIKRHRNAVLYYMGEMARKDSDFDDAISLFKQVTESRYYQTSHVTVARLIQRQRNDQKALDYLINLQLTEEDTDIKYMRALIAAQLNNINLAVSDLRDIIKIEPDHVDALNALGYTLADANKNLNEARELIERAYHSEPGNPAIIDSMGWVLFRLGNYTEALVYLEKAHKLDPSDETTSHLVLTLWNMNQKQDARNMLSQAIDKSPKSKILLRTLAQINVQLETSTTGQ